MKVPFVSVAISSPDLRQAYQEKVANILATGQYILHHETELFEEEFARFCGTRHAVAVSSGTAALRLTLQAMGIGPGDEVITAPNTYFATALAIRQVGARPVFADIAPQAMNLDPDRVAEAITPRTAAVIAVHLYGRLSDMARLREVCRRHGIALIEDAAQAHGAARNGRRAGSFGDAGCFSFHPVKNLGAFGDAGAVTTDDDSLAEKLRRLRNYGQGKWYRFESLGNNDRCDELQAAILRLKLPLLEEWNTARRRLAILYGRLMPPRIRPPMLPNNEEEHVFHLYVVRCRKRDDLRQFLLAHGIDCRIHYPVPLHRMAILRHEGKRHEDLPHAERAADEILSLPLYPELGEEQVRFVCERLAQFPNATEPGP